MGDSRGSPTIFFQVRETHQDALATGDLVWMDGRTDAPSNSVAPKVKMLQTTFEGASGRACNVQLAGLG